MKKSIIILLMSSVIKITAQTSYTAEQAVAVALKNNPGIQAAQWDEKLQQQLRKTSFELPKTNFLYMYGQFNGFTNDKNLTITQAIPFASFGSQRAVNNALSAAGELKRISTEHELAYQVKRVYYQLAFVKTFHELLLQQDSIFEGFLKAASARYRTGETNLLEKTTAETQRNDMKNRLNQSRVGIEQIQLQLQVLLNQKESRDISTQSLAPLTWDGAMDTSAVNANPFIAQARQQIEVAGKMKKFESAKLAPDLLIGYFNQTLIGSIDPKDGSLATSSNRFSGFQIGLGLPIFFNAQQARVKAASFHQKAADSRYQNERNMIVAQWKQGIVEYEKNNVALQYYESSALVNADLILKQTSIALKQGEIGYAEYLLGVRNALTIKEGYLQTINALNQSILYLEFLSAK